MQPPEMAGDANNRHHLHRRHRHSPQFEDLLYLNDLKKILIPNSQFLVSIRNTPFRMASIRRNCGKYIAKKELTIGNTNISIALVTNHDQFKALCDEKGVDGTRRQVNPPFLFMATEQNSLPGLNSADRLLQDLQILGHNGSYKPNENNYRYNSNWNEHTDSGSYVHLRALLLTEQIGEGNLKGNKESFELGARLPKKQLPSPLKLPSKFWGALSHAHSTWYLLIILQPIGRIRKRSPGKIGRRSH